MKLGSFIEEKKQDIYDVVQSLVPKEITEFYENLKLTIPTIEATKVSLLQRCDEVSEFGSLLEGRLDAFNHRIVKMRSDVNLRMSETMKEVESLNSKVLDFG